MAVSILMDMMMPGMDGLAALAELQRTPELRSIPVLVMTAKVQLLGHVGDDVGLADGLPVADRNRHIRASFPGAFGRDEILAVEKGYRLEDPLICDAARSLQVGQLLIAHRELRSLLAENPKG